MMNKVGERIKKLRIKAGLSQERLSYLIKIDRVKLSKSESNKRDFTIDELSSLSKVFNISIDQLINPEKEPEINIIKENMKFDNSKIKNLRIDIPQKNVEKFKQVFLYVLNKVGSKPNLGETVIYKLLYFIDFNYYEKYEEQLIGAKYIKNHYGPTPVEFKKVTEQMFEDGEIEIIRKERFGHMQTRYLPNITANLKVFNGNELEMINTVINKLSDLNARQISEYSHGDVPWIVTEEQEPIEYESVFFRTPQYSVRDDDEQI